MSAKYAVFSYYGDINRTKSVPVGVALWSEEKKDYALKLLSPADRVHGFRYDYSGRFLNVAAQQLQQWASERNIPYGGNIDPWTDAWWETVRDLFVHELTLSESRAIDCKDPKKAVDALFESVVAPHRADTDHSGRIDGEIRKCLSDLAPKFEYKKKMPGFGGRAVPVMRAYVGKSGIVVVEGLNLSIHSQADVNAWQTLGKLRLLRGGPSAQAVALVVGYLPSPEGLNGETPLVEFIQKETDASVFDLHTQRDELHAAVSALVEKSDGQHSMKLD